VFLGVFLGLGGGLFLLLVLVDPYDSGRFPGLGLVGVDDRSPRMAHVSRGRDPQFDSAIFGNSTGQLIDPAAIGPATGRRFTQMTIPKTGPREQVAMMRWFLRNHKVPGALVVVADPLWCETDPEAELLYPFPFWLYGSDLDYLANLVNAKTLERAAWRVRLALGRGRANDQVGFSDYTVGSVFGYVAPERGWTMDAEAAGRAFVFPGIELFRAFLAEVPEGTRVVVVTPPMAAGALAPAGSLEGAVDAACKAQLRALAEGRRGGAFLDYRVDDAHARDPAMFFDHVHYHRDLGRVMERGIVGVLQR
jgi:hypothetical protein